MLADNAETGIRHLHGSRRQVMDWSLVLASQQIESSILQQQGQWMLAIAEVDFPRAQESVQLYQAENRHWRWRQRVLRSEYDFHFGSVLWVVAMIAFFVWSNHRFFNAGLFGAMDNEAVRRGEWWRLFTAMTLHADLNHLISNCSAGVFLLGLVMGKYGPGWGLAAATFAGAGGNISDLLIHGPTHRSIGASGMVMGALGLLCAQPTSFWHRLPAGRELALRGAATGAFIFILWGTSPDSDVVAHVGGFLFGALFGMALQSLRKPARESRIWNGGLVAFILVLTGLGWWLAV